MRGFGVWFLIGFLGLAGWGARDRAGRAARDVQGAPAQDSQVRAMEDGTPGPPPPR